MLGASTWGAARQAVSHSELTEQWVIWEIVCAAFEPPSVPFVRSFDSQKKINWPIKQHTSSLECDLVLHKLVDGGQCNEMTGSRDGEQRQHAIRVTNSYKQFNASQIPFSEDDYFRQGSSPAKVSPPPISVPPDSASINWCAPMYGHETKTYREINSYHRVITDSRNAHLAIAGEEDKKKTLKFNSDLRVENLLLLTGGLLGKHSFTQIILLYDPHNLHLSFFRRRQVFWLRCVAERRHKVALPHQKIAGIFRRVLRVIKVFQSDKITLSLSIRSTYCMQPAAEADI